MLADARFWIGDPHKNDIVLITPLGTFFVSCTSLLRILTRVQAKCQNQDTLKISSDLYEKLRIEFQQHIGRRADELLQISGMWVEVVDGQRLLTITRANHQLY
jgi:hypothetical protein